jgi:uncharacterized protein (TIGR00661 family)
LPARKRILLAALNWGLGHASRCIPIIRELLRQDAEVLIASDGRALRLLQLEFPNLQSIQLPSYQIRYKSRNMVWNMALQLPAIATAALAEHRFVKSLIREYSIDGILSDNRFGCYSSSVKSVFITHQTHILTPPLLSKPVNLVNRWFINRFDQCWIPDAEGLVNLSGRLSHRYRPSKSYFIGPLSRIKYAPKTLQYKGIAILSGPEPQRSLLEHALIRQIEQLPGKWILVQGKAEQQAEHYQQKNLTIYPVLTSQQLNEYLLESEWVICRSGYSSIMDLAVTGNPALFIPTPGQTEQEYLARHLAGQPTIFWQDQSAIQLKEVIQNDIPKQRVLPQPNERLLSKRIQEFLYSL